ncbi:ABC transporter permease [Kitasatospora sp. NBC_00458]|uniref:ABC transporter permease n=1 Tax=Kitasatospora sp. NBC_00458 TaxID=2903568 RepID=UPI002E171159
MSTSLMTGRAVQEPADRPAGPARRRPGGLLWLALRQNRTAIRFTTALFVLAAGALLTAHFTIQDRLGVMERTDCYGVHAWSRPECWPQVQRIDLITAGFTTLFQPVAAAVPLLLGMFLGGPLLAQEYERGTIRMVLAQSVSPRRWLAARLGVAGLVVLPAVGVVAGLTTWVWWADVFRAPVGFDPPFQAFTYPVLGLVPVAWTLFGLTLGVLVGELVRRTVTAVLVSGVLVVVAQVTVLLVRPYFWPVVYEEQPYEHHMSGFVKPGDSWLIDSGAILPDGTKVGSSYCYSGVDGICDGVGTAWGEYHPVSHFVPIQLVETGALVLLSAAALAVVFRRVAKAAG